MFRWSMTRGYINFDSTQRTQSGNKHGKAVRATQLWYVIIYGWANTDTDSFYLLSFEDIMAVSGAGGLGRRTQVIVGPKCGRR